MNLVQPCSNEAGEEFIILHSVDGILSIFFNNLVAIKNYQHFRFLADGSVAWQFTADMKGEGHVHMLKNSIKLTLQNSSLEPNLPSGLDKKM